MDSTDRSSDQQPTASVDLYGDLWTAEASRDVSQLMGPILVVGASGFIGAKLFFSLASRRSDVYGLSPSILESWRLSNFPSLREGQLIAADITNLDQLQTVIRRLRPRTIFNLSAYGAYERQNHPSRIAHVNYIGLLNLIISLQETGCDAFVQAGTSSEYGLNCTAPKENGELWPNSDYAVSKGAGSLLIKYYGTIKNFPCVNLRLYSIYGPWEERDRLIPRLIENGLKGQFPQLVNKAISRDFVHIDDCTLAFVKAALTVCRSEPGLSLNIASGTATSLEKVALTSKSLFGIEDEPEFGTMPNRKWDLSDWYGDPELARTKMSWKAELNFEEGLARTVEWEIAAQDKIKYGFVARKERKISAIIACYKDDEAIPIMHRRLTEMFRKEGIDYEIIFVNDRSPTADEAVIQALCTDDNRVIGISHSRNFGSQSAFISGMEIATGDAVVLMDGDLQDPPEIIPQFIRKWEEGYNIVYGQREKREATWYMQILYKVFYRIFRKLSDVPIPVDAGDFSLIDRRAFKQLLQLPERDQFIRGLRAWIGFKQIGVPYVRPERMFGVSTNNFSKNIWWAKKGIFSFTTKPLNYMQAFAIALVGVTWLLILFYLVNYALHPNQNPRGTNTIILLILGLGGVQLFSVSLLGDYVGKILEEVKNRPRFIRAKIMSGAKSYEDADEIEVYLKSRVKGV